MEQSNEGGGFSFGEVADTEYVSYQIIDTETKLPYHPFQFDLTLTVFKSKPNYQQPGTTFALSRQKTVVFGRKKKNQPQWTESTSIPNYLNAEIISGKHFSISEQYAIKDLHSKNGTYLWVDRDHPKKLEVNDCYLVAKQPLVMVKIIHLPKPCIQMTYQGQIIKIGEHHKVFLIGSHEKCDMVVPSLYHFEICINMASFTIFTHLDEEDAFSDHGLWYKIRPEKKEDVILEHGNLIMADPYIFRVES